MKKIVSILVIVSILISCFAFSVFAAGSTDGETIVEPYDSTTLSIRQLEYFDEDYTADGDTIRFDQRIPSNAFLVMGDTSRLHFELGLGDDIVIPKDYVLEIGGSYTIGMDLGTTFVWIVPGFQATNVVNFSAIGEHSFSAQSTSRMIYKDDVNYCEWVNSWNNNTGQDLYLNTIRFDCTAPNSTNRGWLVLLRRIHFRLVSPSGQVVEEITHGWDPDPTPPPGSDSFNDLNNLESGLDSAVSGGIDEGSSLLSGFSKSLTSFRGAATFLIGVFNTFIDIGWLKTIIVVCLALGLIGFILNFAPEGLSHFMNRRDIQKQRTNRGSRKKGG